MVVGTSIANAVEAAAEKEFHNQPTRPGPGATTPDTDPDSGAVTGAVDDAAAETRPLRTSEVTAAVDAGGLTPSAALAAIANRVRRGKR